MEGVCSAQVQAQNKEEKHILCCVRRYALDGGPSKQIPITQRMVDL